MPIFPYAINELNSGTINSTNSSNNFNDFVERIEINKHDKEEIISKTFISA